MPVRPPLAQRVPVSSPHSPFAFDCPALRTIACHASHLLPSLSQGLPQAPAAQPHPKGDGPVSLDTNDVAPVDPKSGPQGSGLNAPQGDPSQSTVPLSQPGPATIPLADLGTVAAANAWIATLKALHAQHHVAPPSFLGASPSLAPHPAVAAWGVPGAPTAASRPSRLSRAPGSFGAPAALGGEEGARAGGDPGAAESDRVAGMSAARTAEVAQAFLHAFSLMQGQQGL